MKQRNAATPQRRNRNGLFQLLVVRFTLEKQNGGQTKHFYDYYTLKLIYLKHLSNFK